MYESWNPGTVVDDQGRPLVNGRVTVHVHDSYAIADVYTYEGNEYIPAANPQYLDENGRLEATLFVELGVYDVEIQKSNGDGTYEDYDNFEFGIDAKLEDYGRMEVDTVSDLEDLDPSIASAVVTVRSVPRRDYIWDANSVDTPDGGIVIDSNVEGDGNWILLWDSPYLPSSVYGVSPSDISNLGSLFTYPDYVGSMHLRTPQCVLLEQGAYSFNTVVCNKRLAVDKGTTWTGTVRTNQDIEVMGSHGAAIGNIYFTKRGCTAHSMWYADVEDFWHCNADIFVMDNDDNFTSKKLKTYVNLTGKTVHGPGTRVTEYVNGSCFFVPHTFSIPDGFFQSTDYVQLQSYKGDRLFRQTGAWDPGTIAGGNHVEYLEVPDLSQFADADRWLAVMIERRARLTAGQWDCYELDLQGRAVGDFTLGAGSFGILRNAIVTGNIALYGALTLYDCKAAISIRTDTAVVAGFNSEITFLVSSYHPAQVALVDCHTVVNGPNGFDPYDTVLSVTGGSFNGLVKLSNAHALSYGRANNVLFRDVQLDGQKHWRVQSISMARCTGDVMLDILPYFASVGTCLWDAILDGNRFVGQSRVWFGIFATAGSQVPELAGTCRFGTCRIVGNRFDGTDPYGIKRCHWHPFTGAPLLSGGDTWEYHGNSGNCPRLNPGFLSNLNNWPTTEGDSVKWRIYNGLFNIWCPYLVAGDGSVAAAQEPTGLNPYISNAVWAQFYTDVITDPIGHYLYGYRTYLDNASILASLNDENVNNSFVVKLGMGVGGPGVPTFNVGQTFFPGLAVV